MKSDNDWNTKILLTEVLLCESETKFRVILTSQPDQDQDEEHLYSE